LGRSGLLEIVGRVKGLHRRQPGDDQEKPEQRGDIEKMPVIMGTG
jgi:hypothetical protein